MPARASGTFEVKLLTHKPEDPGDPVGRMTIDKQFSGDLVGSSRGWMLAIRTEVQGSAGYVAMERVTGTLAGRSGTFALQHFGIMDRGAPSLTVTVIPDSATGDLAGLRGQMTIDIREGTHFYAFEYEL
jgi:hypothetical protein